MCVCMYLVCLYVDYSQKDDAPWPTLDSAACSIPLNVATDNQ